MPRVAVLRHTFGLASETFVLEQARAFTRWEPVLLSRDALPAGLAGRSLGNGAAAYTAGLGSTSMTRLLRELRVDAVLAHFGVEGSCVLPATRRAGVPLATVFHGFDATTSTAALLRARTPSWVTFARRRARLARQGELFLPVSEHLRTRLLTQGFPADRTITHHLGLDLGKLPHAGDPEPRTVVHVGRLVPKKGHVHLLRALTELPGVRLTCVGDGPLLGELTGLVDELGLGDRVRFAGRLDNAATLELVARSAVLCLPSTTAPSGDQEGLGQVLLEAGALGRPVVASRHGGIPSAVVDGVTGSLVPEADPVALAAALRRVLDDPEFASRLGSAARDHVTREFDVNTRTARLEELLDGVVRR